MAEIELEIVPLLCDLSKISVDVGAYEGEYTEIMRQHSRFVHAFEPVPRRYTALAKKRSFKGKNVLIHPLALSDNEGVRELHIPLFKNRFNTEYRLDAMSSIEGRFAQYFRGNSAQYVKEEILSVPARTLDSFELEDVAFVKVDVEGHELAVLQEAQETIRRNLPHLLVEIEDRHNPGNHARVSSFLENLGYQGYFLCQEKLLTLDQFGIDEMQRKPLERIKHRPTADIPGYVNNFLFFHASKCMADAISGYLGR
jgi:FkbM family methyltransferase